MNELRWILLAAGLLLILGVYFWGRRTRGGAAPAREVPPSIPPRLDDERPAVAEPSAREPAVTGGWRREPSVSLDDGAVDPTARRREPTLEPPADDEEPAIARRARVQVSRAEPQRVPPRIDVPSSGPGVAGPVTRPEPAAPPRAPEPARPQAPAVTASSGGAPAAKPRTAQKIIAVRVSAGPTTKYAGATLRSALEAEGLRFGRYDIFHCLHTDGRPVFSVASLREPGTFDLEAMAGQHYPGVALFTVLPGPVPASDAVDAMMLTARTLAIHLGGAMADERGVPLTTAGLARLREDAIEFERGLATD
jgi:cell division protein ZipA